jgi:DNA sulfur modification protein DndD
LLQSLALALHGSLILGNKVSRQEYNDFLASRFHSHSNSGVLETSNETAAELNFQYVQSGKPSNIQVKRSWHRGSSSVIESLEVLQDGYPPDVLSSDYQTWLNDLIHPGLLPIYFLDAEQLSALASPEDHHESVREVLYRLLGIDL